MVSEPLKKRPHPGVLAFLRQLKVGEAYLSALTLGELAQGVTRAPEARRPALAAWLSGLKRNFGERILPLDAEVMEIWGELTGKASRREGLFPPWTPCSRPRPCGTA